MISEKQKQLCMKFSNGALVEADPPDWFLKHLASPQVDDWKASLARVGATCMDSFGSGETYEVYRSPNGFFVDYMDTFESAAWIFIDRPVDYMNFRATVLAPLAMLAMYSDRHTIWEQEREQAFRSS